jgi:hypothetical protein
VVRDRPELRAYLTRCRHCGILFITHPRNAGRNDLGCPFGCREAHRKNSSTKRSIDYYRTEEGKGKKKRLNERRKKSNRTKENSEKIGNESVDPTTLSHIRMVTSMIEGRNVTLVEILSMLESVLRQHSMDLWRKSDYGCPYHGKRPP